jgi:fumarate reductase subunit C
MAPSRPGRTRTAPPRRPDQAPFRGRYLSHTLFGATGLVYVFLGFLVLEMVWALGSGPADWSRIQATLASSAMIAIHAVCFVSVIFVGVRFFRLFPKAQPPRLGPAKPPPGPVILAVLYAAWIGVSVVLAAILAGGLL